MLVKAPSGIPSYDGLLQEARVTECADFTTDHTIDLEFKNAEQLNVGTTSPLRWLAWLNCYRAPALGTARNRPELYVAPHIPSS